MCFSAGLPCDTICNDVVSQCPSPRVITPPIHRDHILNMLEQVSTRQSTLCSFYRYILLYLLQETNLPDVTELQLFWDDPETVSVSFDRFHSQ